MLQDQVIPINFSSGIDTKTDPKAVVAGKFIRLENGIFTNPNRIAKRNGYAKLGNAVAPNMVHGYQNELIAADSGILFSYSSNQDALISKGNYASVDLHRSLVSQDSLVLGFTDVAVLNNYAVYGWQDTSFNVYGSVVDLSTGTILVTTNLYTAVGQAHIKCALLGGTTLAIFYEKSSAQVNGRTVTFSGGGSVSFSAETAVTSNYSGSFDLIETATGAACVYTQSGTPGITVATISTALAVATATRAVTVGSSPVVAISKTSNGNLWVYWTESTNDGSGNLTALSVYYAVYSSALASVLTRTLAVTTATPYYVSNMIAKGDSATQQTLYYGQFKTNNNGSKHELEYTKYITVDSVGTVGSALVFANGVIPFSHPFTYGSKIYAVFYYRASDITVAVSATMPGPIQPTFFVVELTGPQSPPYVAARFGSGVSNSYAGNSLNLTFQPNVAAFGSSKFCFNCTLVVQENATANTSSFGFVSSQMSTYSYFFDFNSSDANIAKNCGNVSVLNGAVLQMYDGANCTELGFHLFPEITNLTEVNAGGSIANGTYSYIAIFQWIDNQGNLHQSAPSFAKAITTNGMANTSSVTISVTTNFLSRKPNATVAIFRTQNAGSIYYLVGFQIIADATSNAVISFSDTFADTSITSSLQPYSFPGSAVLENTTPPPSMAMVTHNNRLIFRDDENRSTYWYTKSFQPGVGVSPSGFLTQDIDPKFGDIAGLGEMDDKLVIGKQTGFAVQSGDGANDAGSGSTLSFPQFVPSDVGVSEQKSIITSPDGMMFKSGNGIYILTRSLQVAYIGAEVEAYNSQTITGATLVPGKSQIRFLCSSGLTLVYDYIFKQWSTFTNHTGLSSTVWNNTYVYATTSGFIFQESGSLYTDNGTAYALLAQTSWLALASIQGFQRVKRLIMLGDFVNGNSASHALSIQAAYDFSSTFQSAISYQFGSALASGVLQYRERLPRQKCDSISLLIQETTTGSSAEFVDLTNISFEAGVKKGVNKLSALQSVG